MSERVLVAGGPDLPRGCGVATIDYRDPHSPDAFSWENVIYPPVLRNRRPGLILCG